MSTQPRCHSTAGSPPTPPPLTGALVGALMVCGATSDAGKTTVVAGLCRLLARRGVRVAPFKAQNMANNSFVTADGLEIGRAQAFQAFAAGIEPEAAMNPILLKPTGDRTCQVVRNGRPWRTMSAADYHDTKLALLPDVMNALHDLRSRFDVVLCEGAGSPAEINLLDRDIVNLRVARDGGMGALVVGDINPGGVFASLYGTVALLPDDLRACVQGFVINKLRGDPALLLDGTSQLTDRCGVPVVGVIPWIDHTGLDAEDSMALQLPTTDPGPPLADTLDVAVIRLPRISNFTDFEPLGIEPGVQLRYVSTASTLGRPDLVIIPGSKATVHDLAWLRATRLADAITATDAVVLGICAGYQMLGMSIADPHGVESDQPVLKGLGLLDVHTEFGAAKMTSRQTGEALRNPVHGYFIHHGSVSAASGDPFVVLDHANDPAGRVAGVRHGAVFGTVLHGLFDADGFRRAFLHEVATRRNKQFASAQRSFSEVRLAAIDTLADVLDEHLDMAAIERIIAAAATVGATR